MMKRTSYQMKTCSYFLKTLIQFLIHKCLHSPLLPTSMLIERSNQSQEHSRGCLSHPTIPRGPITITSLFVTKSPQIHTNHQIHTRANGSSQNKCGWISI